jgi:hypothetical protein
MVRTGLQPDKRDTRLSKGVPFDSDGNFTTELVFGAKFGQNE